MSWGIPAVLKQSVQDTFPVSRPDLLLVNHLTDHFLSDGGKAPLLTVKNGHTLTKKQVGSWSQGWSQRGEQCLCVFRAVSEIVSARKKCWGCKKLLLFKGVIMALSCWHTARGKLRKQPLPQWLPWQHLLLTAKKKSWCSLLKLIRMFSLTLHTDLWPWCVGAGWGSWRWGRRCAWTPTPRTEGRRSPRSPPIAPSPASTSPASGHSLAPAAARTSVGTDGGQSGKEQQMWAWTWDTGTNMLVSVRLRVKVLHRTGVCIKSAPPTATGFVCGEHILWFHWPRPTCHCEGSIQANIWLCCPLTWGKM